jgi:hypothetical protein
LIDLGIRSNLEKADVSEAAWNRPALWIAVILVLVRLLVGGFVLWMQQRRRGEKEEAAEVVEEE